MKYLSNYTEEATTRALKENGAFFAFSDKQFEEAKDPNIDAKDYVNISMGLIVPRKNAEALHNAIENAITDGIAQDIKENGINNIVIRELYNHEAFYTCDIESTCEALKSYPNITEELILSIFNFERNKQNA